MISPMESAFEEGLSQLSLALFTTLTSGGIVACIIVSMCVLMNNTNDAKSVKLRRYLIIPIALVIIGLIASTNHLGRPSNSLYVLFGVGRSPLSNEVVAVVLFTGMIWITWLLSFSKERFRILVKVMLGISIFLGIVALTQMTSAYSIDTIISWDLPYTRLNLIFAGVISGPIIALATLSTAQIHYKKMQYASIFTSMIFTLCLTVSEILQLASLQDIHNSLYTAYELVPFYPACILVSTSIMLATLGILLISLRRKPRLDTWVFSASSCAILIGVFIVRFAFYCMRLTAGF